MSDSGERTHPASPQRLVAARASGDIPKSFELAASLAMLGALVSGYLTLAQVGSWLTHWTTETWANAGAELDAQTIPMLEKIQTLTYSSVSILMPFFLMVFLFGMASHWAQTGPVWIPDLMTPKASRLGPSRWLSQLSISKLLSTSVLGLPKIAIAFVAMAGCLWAFRESLMRLSSEAPDRLVSNLFGIVVQVSMIVVGVLILLGLVDFGFQWMAHRNRLRMTEQQVRDENRMQEGDSVNRSRQQQLDQV